MMPTVNLAAIAPEIIVLCGAGAVLMIDLFVSDARRHVSFWLTQIVLLAAAWASLASMQSLPSTAFSGMVADDMLADTLKFMSCFAVALGGLWFDWQGMLIVLALLSMVFGNIVAIAQTNIKRMLAYSSIANMGFMLMGFLAANPNGYSAALFYAIAYVLTSIASFGMIMLLSREGFEADLLEDFKGLNQRSPWWAFMMLLVMFSLAGIPPTVGFYAKFTVIQAAVDAGFVWLAVVAVLSSLVGAFYYLRVVKLMYFDDAVDTEPIDARADSRALLTMNGLALLVFGVLPQPLLGVCVVALAHSGLL